MSEFSNRLKQIRSHTDYTQREIAKHLGVSERAYQHYEAGTREPSISQLIALADYFNVSLDYLCGRTEDVEKRGYHVYPQFPGILKQLRIDKGLDIWDFADILEISARNYAGYEIGETMPDLPVIVAFADFFDVSIDYMIGRTNNPELH